MGSLRSSVARDEKGRTRVQLSGAIDESADLEAAFKAPPGDAVVNLEGVERINSIGVHRWIPAFAAFCRGRKVELEALSYPLVLQANMVANLFSSAVITSCLAPYFCAQCQENRMSVIKRGEVKSPSEAPARSCPVCAKPMAFDELDNYFAFFAPQKAAAGRS